MPAAQESVRLADGLVVLQEEGLDALPAAYRAKTSVCLQSTAKREALAKTTRHLRALMVGHLRDEKDPQTYFDAARLLAARTNLLFDHVGAALDAPLGRSSARAVAAACPRYRWLGPLAHALTLRRIRQAHVLVHPSRIEGGAHVVMEAVQSGTPVLASRVSGNVGMLGHGYSGYFEAGDAAGLAALLMRCRDDASMLPLLMRERAARSPLFEPARERATLLGLVAPPARGLTRYRGRGCPGAASTVRQASCAHFRAPISTASAAAVVQPCGIGFALTKIGATTPLRCRPEDPDDPCRRARAASRCACRPKTAERWPARTCRPWTDAPARRHRPTRRAPGRRRRAAPSLYREA